MDSKALMLGCAVLDGNELLVGFPDRKRPCYPMTGLHLTAKKIAIR